MLESLKEYQILARDFKAFDASLRIERPNDVAEWLKEIVEWEGKFPVSTPMPYDLPENSESLHSVTLCDSLPSPTELTLNNVKLRLAHEELEAAKQSNKTNHEVGPSGFISLGMEIEDAQYVHVFLFCSYR